MNFSDKIKYQREQNHLTQKELAELVGVSQRAIAAYESSGTIARISTMRKLAHALNVSYDYLKHDEITDPSYGIEKMDYIDEVNGQLGEKGARDINEILEANRALFAGGELDEEAKDAFYQAVTKAYLSCMLSFLLHLIFFYLLVPEQLFLLDILLQNLIQIIFQICMLMLIHFPNQILLHNLLLLHFQHLFG